MATEPDLVISAGFSDAKLVAEANKVVALYKKKGEEAQKAFQDAQGKVTNTQAANAHKRDLDKLSRAYDPVYRAAKRYEDELKRLDRALDVGAINQKQYAASVGQAAKEMNVASGMIQQTTTASRSMGGSFQQVGYQVGDFAVQVGAGTSAVQALGQQLPQLLGAFGTWGALAGAGAAITIPLGAALLKVAMDTETLDDKLKTLSESTEAYADAATAAADPIDVLRQRYGDLADEVERANAVVSGMHAAIARRDIAAAAKAAGSAILGGAFKVDAKETVSGFDASTQRGLRLTKLASVLKSSTDEARKFDKALGDLEKAKGPDDVVKATDQLLSMLAAAPDGVSRFATEIQNLSTLSTEAAKQIRAAGSAAERVISQYKTDTETLKSLSNDRKVAQELLDKAIKDGGAEAVRIGRERIGMIDQEIGKTRELILANDDAYTAMQRRIKAGAGGFIDRVVEAATGNSASQWGKDLAASQKGILDLIKSRESGGDYNATLDNGKYTGGARDLVNMTINEVLAMQKQMLAHPENTKNSSAAGAYQIVSTTLRGLVKELGLTGDELYSRDMQDRLGTQLVRRRMPQGVDGMRNEWEGLRGVSPAVIQQAMGQQSIPRVDAEVAKDRQKTLDDEIKRRETIAKQAKDYGDQLARNLLSEEKQAELAKSRADQIAEIKASGMDGSQQAAAIAQVNGEIEKQTLVYTLLEEAKRRQVDLDAMLTNGAMTYRQAIEALGEQKKQQIIIDSRRAQSEQQAASSIEFAARAQQTFKDGLLDAIVAGESFSDVLANLAQMFARAALQAALFNEGPFSGGSGSGILGGIVKAAFGGGAKLPARANGGPVSAGSLYMVGERGAEPFVPAVDGRILSVEQAQAAVRGRQSGGSSAVSLSIDLRGTTGDRELDAKIARAGQAILAQVPATMRDNQRRRG